MKHIPVNLPEPSATGGWVNAHGIPVGNLVVAKGNVARALNEGDVGVRLLPIINTARILDDTVANLAILDGEAIGGRRLDKRLGSVNVAMADEQVRDGNRAAIAPERAIDRLGGVSPQVRVRARRAGNFHVLQRNAVAGKSSPVRDVHADAAFTKADLDAIF